MIRKVQVALTVRGFRPGPANGQFSDQTKAALTAFQTAYRLEATGVMDLPTLQLLGVEIAMPARASDFIKHPDWVQQPSAAEIARVYPELPQRLGIEGEVILNCVVGSGGSLRGLHCGRRKTHRLRLWLGRT